MTPAQMGCQFLTQKQRLEAERAGASVTHPGPELPAEEWSDGGQESSSAAESQITTDPDPFGVFWKYPPTCISSHNPKDTDPFPDTSTRHGSVGSGPPATESISSDLNAQNDDSDPLSTTNPTIDLLLGWWFTEGSSEGIRSLSSLVDCLTHPLFDVSKLRGFNPVSTLCRFE